MAILRMTIVPSGPIARRQIEHVTTASLAGPVPRSRSRLGGQIMPRNLVLLLSAALALWGAAPARPQGPPKKRPPNILLIVSDDHHAGHVACYGDKNVKTPNLDKLAASGVRMERAYVTTPQCVPSRASLMTGRSPVGIQMTRFSAPLPADVVTFVELLRDAGYYTGICGRNFHLDGSGNQPPETKAAFEKHKLETFARRVDWLKKGGDGVAQLR